MNLDTNSNSDRNKNNKYNSMPATAEGRWIQFAMNLQTQVQIQIQKLNKYDEHAGNNKGKGEFWKLGNYQDWSKQPN